MARFLRALGLVVCVFELGLVMLLATSRFYSLPEVNPVQAAAEEAAPANQGIALASELQFNGASTHQEPTIKKRRSQSEVLRTSSPKSNIWLPIAIIKTISPPEALLISVSKPDQSPTVESTAPLSSTRKKEEIQSASQQEKRNAITRLVIPDLKLDAEVKYVPFTGNTWEVDDLGQSIAWLGDVNPDSNPRNLVLAGHVTGLDGSHGPFHYLSRLTTDSQLVVYSEHFVSIYKVRELSLVKPEDAYIIEDTKDPRLTLLTCATWDGKSKSYLHRQVVIADLIYSIEVEFIPPEKKN